MLMNISGTWDLWMLPEEKGHSLCVLSSEENPGLPLSRPQREADGTIALPGILLGAGIWG